MFGWFLAIGFAVFALVVVYSCLVVSDDNWEGNDDEWY